MARRSKKEIKEGDNNVTIWTIFLIITLINENSPKIQDIRPHS